MTSKIGYEKKVFSASFQFHSDKINYLAFGKVRSRMYTHSHRALLVGNDVLISNSRADDDDNEITHEKKNVQFVSSSYRARLVCLLQLAKKYHFVCSN